MRWHATRLALATAGIFVALDQATKQLVINNVARGDSVNVFFGIDITNTRNTGVAFGALGGGGALIKILVAVAVIALLAFFFVRASTPWLWLPVGVILGGALGNLADRARIGAVIDFIDPSFWPEFMRNGFAQCIHRERCGSRKCLGLNTAYVKKFGWQPDALKPLPIADRPAPMSDHSTTGTPPQSRKSYPLRMISR